jgi:hypothetical protein
MHDKAAADTAGQPTMMIPVTGLQGKAGGARGQRSRKAAG